MAELSCSMPHAGCSEPVNDGIIHDNARAVKDGELKTALVRT